MGRFRRLCQEHQDHTFAFYYTGSREFAGV